MSAVRGGFRGGSARGGSRSGVSATVAYGSRRRLHPSGMVEVVPDEKKVSNTQKKTNSPIRSRSVERGGNADQIHDEALNIADLRREDAMERARSRLARTSNSRNLTADARAGRPATSSDSDTSDEEIDEEVKAVSTALTDASGSATTQEDEFRDIVLVKTPYGVVSDEFLRFMQFSMLVSFAKSIHARGYSLFGSITHYIAITLDMGMDPFNDDSVKWFLTTGRHVPEDLDVMDPGGVFRRESWSSFSLKEEIEKHELYVGNSVHPDLRGNHSLIDHSKFVFQADNRFIGYLEFSVDVVSRNNIAADTLDFDVNALVFTHEGFTHQLDFNKNDYLRTMREPLIVAQIVDAIKRKEATAVGTFDAGPDNKTRRSLLVSRFRKMDAAGYTIKGFNANYPLTTLVVLDSIDARSCCICQNEHSVGTQVRLLDCCSTGSSKKIMCNECFWMHMKTQAELGRFHKCVLCRKQKLLFVPNKKHWRTGRGGARKPDTDGWQVATRR